MLYPFPKRQIVDSSKLKKFADDNLKFDNKCTKVLQTSRKHSVFKRLVLQTRKNQGLFGKGVMQSMFWKSEETLIC